MNENGFTAKIQVFDSQGRMVKDLVNCQIVGSKSRFVWSGLDDNDNILPAGIYIVFVELFDNQGVIKRYKKAAVIACK